MNKGFTLIELLVVVLIIGILAAVALPQYTKAVERSRAAEAMQTLGDVATAESIYYMANGSYTSNLTLLDLEFPNGNSTGAITGQSYNIQVNGAAGNMTATATRNGGTYSGQTFVLSMDSTGKISRSVGTNTAFSSVLAGQWK